jgi:hypothetical protein
LLIDVYFYDDWKLNSINKFNERYTIGVYYAGTGNTYAVYSSGEIQLYNGIGTPIQEMLSVELYRTMPK